MKVHFRSHGLSLERGPSLHLILVSRTKFEGEIISNENKILGEMDLIFLECLVVAFTWIRYNKLDGL